MIIIKITDGKPDHHVLPLNNRYLTCVTVQSLQVVTGCPAALSLAVSTAALSKKLDIHLHKKFRYIALFKKKRKKFFAAKSELKEIPRGQILKGGRQEC